MNAIKRIDAFIELGTQIRALSDDDVKRLAVNAEAKNNWFTEDNVRFALSQIGAMLQRDNLQDFVSDYNLDNSNSAKVVGLVSAGNIPLVGFHDLMCILLSGHHAMVKFSSEDNFLPNELLRMLLNIRPEFKACYEVVNRLNGAEAYIATGSNNTARYFEYYFSKKPHIIRKNRTSVGLLNGKESEEDLENLSEDLLRYFGLGCRNISKVFVPEGYRFDALFEALYDWGSIIDHNKYNNNYSYNRSIYLLEQKPFLDNNFFIIKEDGGLHSPVGVLYYETYANGEDLEAKIKALSGEIQVIASKDGWYEGSQPFGRLQRPDIDDFADGVDTMKFLCEL